jgi:hypothetical protein
MIWSAVLVRLKGRAVAFQVLIQSSSTVVSSSREQNTPRSWQRRWSSANVTGQVPELSLSGSGRRPGLALGEDDEGVEEAEAVVGGAVSASAAWVAQHHSPWGGQVGDGLQFVPRMRAAQLKITQRTSPAQSACRIKSEQSRVNKALGY